MSYFGAMRNIEWAIANLLDGASLEEALDDLLEAEIAINRFRNYVRRIKDSIEAVKRLSPAPPEISKEWLDETKDSLSVVAAYLDNISGKLPILEEIRAVDSERRKHFDDVCIILAGVGARLEEHGPHSRYHKPGVALGLNTYKMRIALRIPGLKD